jgi:tight adherence protein B
MIVPTTNVRLSAATGIDRAAGVNERLSSAADRFVASRDKEGELDAALDAAGLALRPGEFVLLSMVGVAVATLLGSLVGGAFLGIVFGLLAMAFLGVYLNLRIGRRRRMFADQLTDALGILAGSLRSGRGLPQAIDLAASEAPSPTAEQFQRVVFETRVGRDLTTSLLAVAHRMKSQDFEWVSRAVDINRELGGDLTELLDNVADTIRERRRVARQVRALSAEGRASGWVLLTLPFVMLLFLAWRNPDHAALLFTHPMGQTMSVGALISMFVGYVWIRMLVNVKY